jgi:hypothetical protein
MAKYKITGLPNNKFSNGGEKSNKDKWGRSKGSKWYGFDPDTKEWTLGLPDWKKEEQAKKFKVLNSFSGPFMTPTVGGSSIFSPNQLNIAQPIIPENVKQKQQEALSAELLKNGMIDATRLIRQGGLDKNKEEFIKQQVLEQSGLPTSSQYNFAKNQIVQNKLEELDAAKVNKKPIDLKKFTDDSNKVDYVKTQEQQGWEAMNSLLNDMDNDADIYYNEVKKISDKERGDKSNRDLLREDLLKAINEGKDVDQLLTKIKDKSGEWQYKQLEKKEADTPWIDADSFTPLGLFSKGTKLGQLQRDFVADPLNVAEELIWDQDYMVNRNEILRDPSHPLHAYYMKRTGMDKSPLSQTLQYINPFSSAAESSVAIGKGDYGDAAYQFGEGLVKTAGIAGAVELAPFLGQYTIPGTSGFLPGLTYSQGLNILGAGYGATQVPKTFKSIKKAFEKGDKESIRAAVNQTGTNALDFLGIGELKNVWNVPEKSIFYLAEDLTNSKNFAKDIKDLKATGAIDDFTVQDRLDLWKDAMLETQLKYQKEGYLMKPADVLKNPDMAQYLKSTFEEMKAERVAYLQSPEGRVAVQQMIDEFPEITTGNPDMFKGKNKFGKVVDNTENAIAKRVAEEIEKDPDAFFDDFVRSSMDELSNAQQALKYIEADPKRFPVALADEKRLEIQNLIDQQKLVFATDKKDLASLVMDQEGNAIPFLFDDGMQSTKTFQRLSGRIGDEFAIVKPNRDAFTVDDYIKQLENQSYVEAQNILADNQNFETLRLEGMKIRDDLSKMAPNTPGRGNLERKLKRIEDELLNQVKGPTGNVKYNAFHSPIDNQTIIGRAFLPQIGENKPLVMAHEMAHGKPQSWTGFNRKAPLKDIFRNYGSQGSWRQGVHPVDKVLSEIDLFDAPPDFTKYRSMRPWYKGDGTNPWPTTAEQIEKGQGMPSLEFSQTTGIADANEALEFSGQEWNKAKDYFVRGSFGNEKVTFMAELKQAMLNSGYGERGKFTMKDLESFWKDYIQSSTKGTTTGWDLRLLDIARPTTRTKKYMLKGLNMPGYKKGGSIQLELSNDQIQDYVNRGYVVEESMSTMQGGGQIVREMWEEVTGTPWQEAKTRGLTTGTYDENIALRNRLLAGEFGKLETTTPKNQYELAVEDLVKKGKTLDELVTMRVGTEEGLKKRFPELFDEEVKQQIETEVEEEDDKYGLSSKINYKPYSDFGKVKSNNSKLSPKRISTNTIEPSEFSSFDLDTSWKYKTYSDFGKPKVNRPTDKKDKWGRSTDNKWYGFNPETKQWTLGVPKWKKDQLKLNDEDKKVIKKIIPNKNQKGSINKVNKSEVDFIQGLKSQIEEINKIKTINKELNKEKKKLTGSALPQGSMGYKNFDNLNYSEDNRKIKSNENYYEPGILDEIEKKYDDTKKWAEDQLETLEKGVKRKLTTFGIIDDNDKEVEEIPMTVDKYYSNPYGAQQVLDIENGNGRQFKQQNIPLSTIKFGYRNRGNLTDINTDGLEITTFEGFSNNPKGIKDWNSIIALDPNGKLHTGTWGKLKDKQKEDWVFTKTFMNKVVSIDDKFLDGSRSGNRGYWQPQITTIDDKGETKTGALNILTEGKSKEKYYGSIQGGRVLIVDPTTNEQYLISGSLDHIKKEFKRIKGNKPYLNVYTLDNGTYSRGLSYKDKKLTKERLRSYDNENTSGGNGLYIVSYDTPINKYSQEIIKNMPNIRTKKDESYKKGHKLKNNAQIIVLHHTGNIDPTIGKEAIRKQYMKKGNNSSHVVIYQDGSREVFASPEQVTFHAGQSKWGPKENLNDFSIGVEFDGDTNYAPLTEQQIESFVEYYNPLAQKYNIKLKDIITHQMIRDRYLKAHKSESKKVKEKPDITQTEYRRILNYLRDNGYE